MPTDAKLLKALKTGKSGEVVSHVLYGRADKVYYRPPSVVTQALNRLKAGGLILPDAKTAFGSRPVLSTAGRDLLFGTSEPTDWIVGGWMLIYVNTSRMYTYRSMCYYPTDVSICDRVRLTPELMMWLGWLSRHTHGSPTGRDGFVNLHDALHFALTPYGALLQHAPDIKSPSQEIYTRPDFVPHRWLAGQFGSVARCTADKAFSHWFDTRSSVGPVTTSRRQVFIAVFRNKVVNPAKRIKPLVVVRDGPRQAMLNLTDFLERPELAEDLLAASELITVED